MMRRVPFIPTIVVLAAIAVLIRLGIWQLHQAKRKEALLARLNAQPQARAA